MDDLLDLDWDKKPAAPPSRQQGAAAPAYRAPGQSSTYSFDALTRSMPSTAAQTQKKPSPSPSPTPPMGHSLSSQSQAPKAQAQAQASAAKSGDAFSSLFAGAAGGGGAGAATGAGASSSSSFSSTLKANSNLSMAQRLQGNSSNNNSLLNPTRANQSQKANGDAWSGLESLGFSQPASKGPSPSVSQNQSNDDFFNFDDFTSQKAAPRAPTAAAAAATAARSKASAAAPPATAPQPKSKDPFDFSDFEDPGDSQSSALGGGGGGGGGERGRRKEREHPSEGPIKAAQTGLSRGPGLLGDDDYDDGIDDGILGALGGPPGRAKPATTATTTATGASQPRPASPPPHIIGQVVEMGFSPFEAREALARTGNDVSAALEQLLASSSSSSKAAERPSHSSQEQEDRRYAERLQRREQAAQRPPASSSSNERNGPERRRRDDDGDTGEEGQVDWQKQADQIYAQASELGASVFSKANAFWTTAKAQAQRALEERNNLNLDGQGSSAASSGRNSPASGSERAKSRRWAVPSRDGRSTPRKEWEGKPRWMVEAEAAAAAEEEEEQSRPKKQPSGETAPTSSFRDDDDGDEVSPAPPFLPARPEGSRPREDAARNLWDMNPQAPPPSSSAPARPQASKPRPGAAAAAAPASGARRTPAAKAAAAAAAAARTARLIEEDGAAAVESSKRHKARGNEHFKKGAYGEAEAAYSAGLDALDAHPKSLRRVPLLNNRANARLKNGDARAVLADTKDVLVLIVAEGKSPFTLYRPSEEAPLPGALAQEVNLRDGYAKALLRRAQAEEMLEQWDTARSVWTLLVRYEKEEGSSGTTGVTNLRAAQEGAKRCQKMLQPAAASEGGAQHKDVVRQKVDRATARAVAKAEESARARIRAENAATAAEEAAKHALRDGVDARILAWKGGKEANVRALLASLQDVVWDGLGWKKVGMHELVTDAQVKRNYMKAIGKLHPDKLTPRNNSLEERLLGGAVFSVLNDAWSAQP